MVLRRMGSMTRPRGDAPADDPVDIHQPNERLDVALLGIDRALPATIDRGEVRNGRSPCSDEEAPVDILGVGPRPSAIAYDPERRLLFIVNIGDPPGANPSVAVVGVDDGRVSATFPLLGTPRWAFYDPATERVYVAVGLSGGVQIVDAETLRPLEVVWTEGGDHTTAWDGERRTLYVITLAARSAAVYRDA